MLCSRKDIRHLLLLLLGILIGCVGVFFPENEIYHRFYVVAISIILFVSIMKDDKGSWIRPYSLLVMSFFVFVWMRYILKMFYDDLDIISIGNGINNYNINIVSIWLGTSMCVICIVSIMFCQYCYTNSKSFFYSSSVIKFPKYVDRIILVVALAFFSVFLVDSIMKIDTVQSQNYLEISEDVLLEGYIWFSLGKWVLLIWIIFGRDNNRFFIGSTILLVAALGYIMRGARGYTIMYFFMWLVFLSQRKKIKLWVLAIIGIALLILASFILSYRLGYKVASGFEDIIKSTLHQQGASIEPVFGSVIYSDLIKQSFSPIELFFRDDFGTVVDKARGVNFEYGGFGSSFFAEDYFLGFPFSVVFLLFSGVCVGFVEGAYKRSIIDYKKKHYAEYANVVLLMTIPNLVYIGRSSINDFIFKTILVVIILIIFRKPFTRDLRRC